MTTSSVSFFLADLQNQKTSLGSSGSLVSGAWSRFTSVLTATNLAPFAFLLLLLFQDYARLAEARKTLFSGGESNELEWP